jgi:hypothetical protein
VADWAAVPTTLLRETATDLRHEAERFVEEVRGDDPELASYLRIEGRELEAGGVRVLPS